MSEMLFDVVFKGKFVNNIDKATAVKHFSQLFKLPIEKAEIFFDGSIRTLKKSQTMDKANHFRTALKKAGIRVSLNKIVDETVIIKPELSLSDPGVILVNKPFVQPKAYNVSQFTLDEVGATMVTYKPVEKKHYDLDNFQVDEVGSIMAEKPKIPEPDLDISNITMEEVGAVFAEKQKIKEPEFDFNNLNLEEVGSTIVEKKKIPEPKFNIDNIKLAD